MKYIKRTTNLKKYPLLWDRFLTYLILADLVHGDPGSGVIFKIRVSFYW